MTELQYKTLVKLKTFPMEAGVQEKEKTVLRQIPNYQRGEAATRCL